jgi:hypothetical protein
VLPVIGHTESAIGAGKCFLQTLLVVGVPGNQVYSRCGKRLRLVGAHVSGDAAWREGAVLVGHDGAHETSALRTCRAEYCNDFPVGHDVR